MKRNRNGFTLLEVLISAMVIMVGILGIATLIPASKYQINESVKADMAANYGRATLKTLVTQREEWLDELSSTITYHNWNGGTGGAWSNSTISEIAKATGTDFFCSDDLQIDGTVEAEDGQPPQYLTPEEAQTESIRGKFETVVTIVKLDEGYCSLGVAVCSNRPLSGFSLSGTFQNNGYGGGDIQLDSIPDDLEIRVGDWVFISNTTEGYWYRIVGSGLDKGSNYLQVSGPDWVNSSKSVTIASPGNVVGAFTEVVPLYTR
ncbi:MAG: prepilin-type N-terminal cleavage/methylation domain-containing protein [Planctomycetia bacterium]|nr:prepilin-type N-terminal cleavage/methylation domain-containing protein [Planctomycetia bacterium]